MTKRTALKWLHWLTAAMILYFYLIEPEDVEKMGAGALATHAGVGVLLAIVVGVWTIQYLRHGLLAKAGPKIPALIKPYFGLMHKFFYYLVPIMVLTGALAGFAAPFVIYAFDIFPINPGFGTKGLHNFFEDVHEIVFNILTIAIVGHAAFHIWRHFGLKDNALRIIMPKRLHKYL